jgi:hypothetical protein
MVVIGCVGINIFASDNLNLSFPGLLIEKGDLVCDTSTTDGDVCELGNRQSKKRILAYGDSHMNHISRQLVSQLGADYSIDFIYYRACFMSAQKKFSELGNNDVDCKKKKGALLNMSGSSFEAVITGQRWHGYGIVTNEDVKEAIKDRIKNFGIITGKLIILGSTSEVDFRCERSKSRRVNSDRLCWQSNESKLVNRNFIEVTDSFFKLTNVFFVYPYNYLCPNDLCVVRKNGISNYTDPHHLSFSGGRDVVNEISEIIRR